MHLTQLGRKEKERERNDKAEACSQLFSHSAYVYFCSGPTPSGLRLLFGSPPNKQSTHQSHTPHLKKKNQSVLQVERKTLKVSSRAQLQHNLKYVIRECQ